MTLSPQDRRDISWAIEALAVRPPSPARRVAADLLRGVLARHAEPEPLHDCRRDGCASPLLPDAPPPTPEPRDVAAADATTRCKGRGIVHEWALPNGARSHEMARCKGCADCKPPTPRGECLAPPCRDCASADAAFYQPPVRLPPLAIEGPHALSGECWCEQCMGPVPETLAPTPEPRCPTCNDRREVYMDGRPMEPGILPDVRKPCPTCGDAGHVDPCTNPACDDSCETDSEPCPSCDTGQPEGMDMHGNLNYCDGKHVPKERPCPTCDDEGTVSEARPTPGGRPVIGAPRKPCPDCGPVESGEETTHGK